MKIRNGFVSNSSSSSFIVGFPKNFTPTINSVHELMFGVPLDESYMVHAPYGDNAVDSSIIAAQVTADMKDENGVCLTPNDTSAIGEALTNGQYGDEEPPQMDWGVIFSKKCSDEERELIYKKYDKAFSEYLIRVSSKLISDWSDHDIYVFEYGDENGRLEAIMEHANIFGRLKVVKISNH